jgi:2-dehydropantoate 2-reductase
MGTLLGHGLCKAGYDVSVLDLPERIAQIQSTGQLVVIAPDGKESGYSPALATTDYSRAGIQDVVLLATKSQDLPKVARGVRQLTDDSSIVVTLQNGIPWWYLYGLESEFKTSRIQCLDPKGVLHESIDPSNIVGCVAYPAAMIHPDGRVQHVEGVRFPVGELDGTVRERTRSLAHAFEAAGFKSRVINDIRSEIWLKAWGAISINPVSALTRATMVDICSFAETRELIETMMHEIKEIAEALGASFRHTIAKRIEGAKAVGAHKTSMLQDVEAGRELELDALMLAVLELADLVDHRAPTVQNIYACTALLNRGLLQLPQNVEANAV